MKQSLRGFSLGLLATTIIFSIQYFFFTEESDTSNEQPDDIEMIQLLEEQGFHVFSNDGLEAYLQEKIEASAPVDTTETDDIEDTTESQSSSDDSTSNNEVIENDTSSFVLTIEPGMTVSEVSNYLIIANLIESREEFVNYLSENNYETNIQVGSFTLNRDMSLEEVVEIIANKN